MKLVLDERVTHPKFGTGVVVQVSPGGPIIGEQYLIEWENGSRYQHPETNLRAQGITKA